MPNDTVTFALDGDVTLAALSTAMRSLHQLVTGLADDVATGVPIDWYIEDLAPGSAMVTVRGESENAAAVENVTRAYLSVGRALEMREPIPYTGIIRQARALVALLDGEITHCRFETQEAEAVVTSQPPALLVGDKPQRRATLGAIEGIVQTLSRRRGLRFTLYDSTFDKAVSCYLQEDGEEMMRNVWGRRAIVEGLVTRDLTDGRPLTVRRVASVELVPDYPSGSYRLARGIIPLRSDDLSPEEAIRRVRDAE